VQVLKRGKCAKPTQVEGFNTVANNYVQGFKGPDSRYVFDDALVGRKNQLDMRQPWSVSRKFERQSVGPVE
jgi:hypothetical protein